MTNPMKATKSIQNWMDEVCSMFPDLRCRYAYEHGTKFHVVQVVPESYQKNDKYAAMVMEFENWFQRRFPQERLLITEPDAHDDMSDVRYDRRGQGYLSFDSSSRTAFSSAAPRKSLATMRPSRSSRNMAGMERTP